MISKKLIKHEIEKLQDDYLKILYKIIKAFEALSNINAVEMSKELSWREFIEETYGSLSDSQIERGEQGVYEMREVIK